MDENKSFVRFVIISLSVILVLAISLVLLAVYRFSVFTPPVDTGVPFAPSKDGDDGEQSLAVSDAPEYVREERLYNFLVLGTDRAAGLADAIILASMDSTSGNVSLMQIPRDTYIELDGEGRKINGLLPLIGVRGIADILERSLCINIDRTAVIDLDALSAIVDAVGGVEVYIPEDMKYDDPFQDLHIDLKQGTQLLNGEKAEQFVRFRSGYADGDLGRVDAQKDFLCALFKKVRDEFDLTMAGQLLPKLLPMIDTDVTAEEALFFANCFFSGDTRELLMLTLPGRQLYSESFGSWYYVLSRGGTLEAINKYFNVYSSEVTDALFDKSVIFCPQYDVDFERIYIYSLISPTPQS